MTEQIPEEERIEPWVDNEYDFDSGVVNIAGGNEEVLAAIRELTMLMYISNQRIYDLLALIAAGDHAVALKNLNKIHQDGKFLAPEPNLNREEDVQGNS